MTTDLCGSVPAVGAPPASECNVGYGFWLVANKLAMSGTHNGIRADNAAQSLRLDCTTGEYWVEVAETVRAAMSGASDTTTAQELVNGQNPNSVTLTVPMTNPFYAEAVVMVQHEFAYDFDYSDSDSISLRGDVNISGAGSRLDGGGTTGQFLSWSYDGSAKTVTNQIARVLLTGTYEIIYTVPPGASFTLNQLGVLLVGNVGAGRWVYAFHNGIKARIFARKV